MKIYVGHSRDHDYKNGLYAPLRQSELNSKAELIFPHESDHSTFVSKRDLKNVDLMIAEISYPSTGLGIEMGYADIYNIPVIVAYRSGSSVSGSAKALAAHTIEYANSEELIVKIAKILKTYYT